jgi:hypothetical protein
VEETDMLRASLILLAAALLCLVPSSPAGAGGLGISAGLEAQGTSWAGDAAGHASLRADYRWARFGLYVLGKTGYGEVDERTLQHFGAGATVWGQWRSTRPYLRAGLVHQHEIPGDAVEHDPIGSLTGFGSGIRHRGGAGGAIGLQLPLRDRARGDFFIAVEINADYLIGAPGPGGYWGGGAAVGFSHDLGGADR